MYKYIRWIIREHSKENVSCALLLDDRYCLKVNWLCDLNKECWPFTAFKIVPQSFLHSTKDWHSPSFSCSFCLYISFLSLFSSPHNLNLSFFLFCLFISAAINVLVSISSLAIHFVDIRAKWSVIVFMFVVVSIIPVDISRYMKPQQYKNPILSILQMESLLSLHNFTLEYLSICQHKYPSTQLFTYHLIYPSIYHIVSLYLYKCLPVFVTSSINMVAH